jgi:hypothetical protein
VFGLCVRSIEHARVRQLIPRAHRQAHAHSQAQQGDKVAVACCI